MDADETLNELKDALRNPNVSIRLPYVFGHGGVGVQVYVKTRKVGPLLLRAEGQTLADVLHMLGTMAEADD